MKVIVEYGPPVVAPNGDVYTWKRTKKYYSVVKWVWVDGADAPVVTGVSDTAGGLEVKWRRPRRTKGGIRAYRVYRATDVCGPYEVIAEVPPGRRGYLDGKVEQGRLYFYRVRAVTAQGPGGWSNKAPGRIPEPAEAKCKSHWPVEEFPGGG